MHAGLRHYAAAAAESSVRMLVYHFGEQPSDGGSELGIAAIRH